MIFNLDRASVFAEARRTSSTRLVEPVTFIVTESEVVVLSVFNCAAVASILLIVIGEAVLVFNVLIAAISSESRVSVIVIEIKSPANAEVPNEAKSANAPLSVA